MATLYNTDSGEEIGHISHQELEKILRILGEETDASEDEFYLDEESLDMLEDNHMKISIIEMLRHALGEEDSIQVTYEED